MHRQVVVGRSREGRSWLAESCEPAHWIQTARRLEREARPELTAMQQGRKAVHEVVEAYPSS